MTDTKCNDCGWPASSGHGSPEGRQCPSDGPPGYFAKYISSACTGWLGGPGGYNYWKYVEDPKLAYKFKTESEANTAMQMWHRAQQDDQPLKGEWRAVQDRDAPFPPDDEDFCFAGGPGMTPEEVWEQFGKTMTYEQNQSLMTKVRNDAIEQCAEKIRLLGGDDIWKELLKLKR